MFAASYDHLYRDFGAGRHVEGIDFLAALLGYLRKSDTEWPGAISDLRKHPLFEIILRDPYTAHSYARPRGYPGDAELIDMIYNQHPGGDVDLLGRELFDRTTAVSATEAVRQRLSMAREILQSAVADGKSICSLACGYLREAEPLAGQDLGRFTAVDLDRRSLDIVRGVHGQAIEIIEANVLNWLRTAAREGRRYDLVYSLGLTDYLTDRQLRLMTRLAAGILAPGGKLLLANFDEHPWAGYMEAAMDWQLIYRTDDDMASNAEAAGCNYRLFRDKTGHVVFCEMWR